MAKSWQQQAYDALGSLSEVSLEALDNVRHKAVEQSYFGQEQTGYLYNIYGTNFSNENTTAQQNTAQGGSPTIGSEQGQEPQSREVNDPLTQRPDEQSGWWHGEPETRTEADNNNDNIAPHNGWSLGQDAWETRQGLEKPAIETPAELQRNEVWGDSGQDPEQDAPEQER